MGKFIGDWLDDDDARGRAATEPIAEGAGLTMPQLALAWVLRRPEVASAIIGASRPEQVHAEHRGMRASSSPATSLDAIDEALGDVPVRGPVLAPGATGGVTRRPSA